MNPKILDKYIIKTYLKTFFFTALLFSLIAVVIDFSDRLDAFMKSGVSTYEVVMYYYIHWIAFINGLLWPLFALIGVIFFTSRLAKNSEFISILNAGVGFHRLLVPYMVAATFIFVIHLGINHYIVPLGSKIRIPFENKNVWRTTNQTRTKNIHVMLDPTTKLYIRNYRERDSTALDMRIETYHDTELTGFIEAKRASWLGPPNKWQLENYIVRRFEGEKEYLMVKQGSELDTTVNITPTDLTRIKNQHQVLTTPELKEYILQQKNRGIGGTRIFETELYRRSSEPVSIFVLTLIGMALASRKVRGGIGLHLAIGISLGAIFIVLSRFTMTFTNAESLGPVVGVWLPNIVFFLISLVLIRYAQK